MADTAEAAVEETVATQEQPSKEQAAAEKARAKAMEAFKRTLDDKPANEAAVKEQDTDGAADEAAGSEEESKDDDGEARFQAALRAVVRSKIPKDVREGMSREQILAWGDELIPQQTRVDEAFAALKGNKPSTDEAEPDEPESTEAKADEPPVTDTTLKELSDGLAEDLGLEEDGAQKLQSFARAIVASTKPDTDRFEADIGFLGTGYVEMAKRVMQLELGERFPELKDPTVSAEWWTTFQRIRPGFDSVEDARDTAAEMVVAPVREHEEKKETANASSTRPSNRRKPGKALTPEERQRRAGEAALRFGSDVEAARRWAGF